MDLEDLFKYFGEEAPEFDCNTVNGWAAIMLDKLPKRGDRFEYRIGDRIFKALITKADERKALEVNLRVEKIDEGKEGDQ